MDISEQKERLLAEKNKLEKELGTIAVRDTDNPADWDAMAPADSESETRDEVADKMEEVSERKATEFALEHQLKLVNEALEKIEAGTYGTCIICKKEIEEERLEANPSARTCIKDMDADETLI